MQNGYFFSREIYNFVSEKKNEYDVIIFHLIRSAQYLPNNFSGKTILDMTDLISSNYKQIIKELSFFNPLKYIYFFEKLLLKNYEKKVSNSFDKIIFVSEKELSSAKDFIKNGNIEIGGQLPINTNGGQLGEAYIHGMNGIAEAVRQIRGLSVNQVPDVENVLVTAGTAVPTSGLILTQPE